MLSAKSLRGKAVRSQACGAVLGTVTDLFFDAQQHRLAALHVQRPGWPSARSVVYWQDVHFVENADSLAVEARRRMSPLGAMAPHWRTPFTTTGRWRVRVCDGDGKLLGWCSDMLVLRDTGRIGACVISHGFWRDFIHGTRLLHTQFTIDAADSQLLLKPGES